MDEPSNRFTVRVRADLALEWGAAVLLASGVILAPPFAAMLFATNGVDLRPGVARVLGLLQAGLGLLGLLAWAAAVRLRGSGRRLPIRVGHVAVACLIAFAGFVAAEALLRTRGLRKWGSAVRTPLPLSVMRRGLELNLRPGRYAQSVRSDFDSAYRRLVFATINRQGLRGHLPDPTRPPDRFRIVALGGSTTFGYTVTDGEEWPARLENALGRRRAEVLNAGRPGSTTFRDYSYLRDRLAQFRPDAVVLYEGFNDLWRAVRRHGGEQPDYGRVDEGLPGKLEELDLGTPRPWPLRPSFLAHYLGLWLNDHYGDDPAASPEAPAAGRVFELDPAIVEVYEHNLRSIVRFCRQQGSVPVVVTFASAVDPSRPDSERRARLKYVLESIPQLDPDSAEEAFGDYRELTRRMAREEGVPLVDLAELFGTDLRHFTDSVHFTPAGEQRVADILASELRRLEPRLR